MKEVFLGNIYIFMPFHFNKASRILDVSKTIDKKYNEDLSKTCRKTLDSALHYIEEFNERCITEISDGVHQSLKRVFIGQYDLACHDENEDLLIEECTDKYLSALFFVTLHEQTGLAVVTILLQEKKLAASQLLDRISQKNTRIKKTSGDGEDILITTFFEREFGMYTAGNTRVCLSTKNEIDPMIAPYYFANETFMSNDMSAQLISETFNRQSRKNIAEYDSSDIFVGKNSVLRIDRRTSSNSFPALESDIVFLFIMETLVFKDSAVSRTNKKVLRAINENAMMELDVMDVLTSEFSHTMAFWNINIFKYVSAQNLANTIDESFGIDKTFESYFKNQEFLQHRVNIKQGINQQKENVILYLIAIIVFFFESLQFFNSVYSSLLKDNKLGENEIISTSATLGTTGLIYIILVLLMRYKKKVEILD